MPYRSGGWRQKVHYARFLLWVVSWTLRWRPSWIYASDPLACPIALLLSFMPGVRVVYHEHDSPMPDAERDPRTTRFMRTALGARRRLVRRAALCVLPAESRALRFQDTFQRARVLTVWNCPRRTEASRPHPPRQSDRLRVWYHGSIVPARVPLATVRALARLPDSVTLTIAGYETLGHQGWVEQLGRAASREGVAHRVMFLGPIPQRADLLQACGGHDVGLALLPLDAVDINEREMAGASNKPFDYMARSLALLVSDLPAWRAMYVDQGYARACDPGDPESIAAALRWFLEHPEETSAMGERGRRRIVDVWNYDRSFQPVLERLLGVQAGAPRVCLSTRA
jgi:glycosyltransferase involved in cell wall biosynthesis